MSKEAVACNPMSYHNGSGRTTMPSLRAASIATATTRLSLVFTRQGEMTTFSMTEREGDIRVLMDG
jgi:hypothetical protein